MPFSPLNTKFGRYYSIIVVVSWYIYLLSPLLFVIRFISRNVLNLNIPIHKAVSLLIVHIPSVLVPLFIILFLGMIYFYPKNSNEKNKRLFGLILISALISEAVLMWLRFFALNRYPTFLYSKIGLPIEIVTQKSIFDIYFILFIWIFIKVSQLSVLSIRNRKALIKIGLFNMIQIATVILIIFGLILHLTALPNEILYLVQGYNYKYYNWGSEYQYVQALYYTVPQTANIILPPNKYDWPLFSYRPVVRYFLFPRSLIGGEYLDSTLSARIFSNAYFFEANSYISQNPWPIINIQDKSIMFNYKDSISYKQLDMITSLGASKIYKITF